MSLEKAVPTFLRHNEVERGGYGQNAPIRYAPEQEMKSDVSDVTNQIQLPGKTKTYLKVWNGKGSNESFLDFVMTSLGLIKRLGYWKKLKEADEAVLKSEESVKVGGALVKWPKYFFPPMTMKLTRTVGMECLSTMLKFQVKKFSGRSPFYGKTAKKSVFTSDSTSDLTSQAHISACTSSIDPGTSTQYQ